MDNITKYLHKIAYKFPKGYPDMDDPKDKDMLFELIKTVTEAEEEVEIDVDVETSIPSGGSETYNDTIRYAIYGKDYKDKPIPKPKSKYPYKNSTFSITVSSEDKELFTKLYPVKPPKVGKEVGSAGSLGVGNGEIALYWLYHFSNSAKVTEGREKDDPDLYFNNQGVEVKSWSTNKGLHGLGRFGADKENLSLLSLIFGFSALVSVFDGEGELPKTVNPTNFRGFQLTAAMEKVKEFKSLLNKNNDLIDEYPLFKNIKSNVDRVYNTLNLEDSDSPQDMGRKMAIQLLKPKLDRKPGDGNHLANVKDNGDVKFFQINFDELKNSDELMKDFEVKQSAIRINFDKIWG